MQTVESLKKYTLERKDLEDKFWLEETKRCITRTSKIRDELGGIAEAKAGEPKTKLTPSAIQRPSVNLIPTRSKPHAQASPKKLPLQLAQYQILTEATSNLWQANGKQKEEVKLVTQMHQGRMRLDVALMMTKPLDKGEKTYEAWWRQAVNKIPQKAVMDIQETLTEVGAYFHTHTDQSIAQPMAKSATALAAQIARAKEPPYLTKLGKELLKYIQSGLSILSIWNPQLAPAKKALDIGVTTFNRSSELDI